MKHKPRTYSTRRRRGFTRKRNVGRKYLAFERTFRHWKNLHWSGVDIYCDCSYLVCTFGDAVTIPRPRPPRRASFAVRRSSSWSGINFSTSRRPAICGAACFAVETKVRGDAGVREDYGGVCVAHGTLFGRAGHDGDGSADGRDKNLRCGPARGHCASDRL